MGLFSSQIEKELEKIYVPLLLTRASNEKEAKIKMKVTYAFKVVITALLVFVFIMSMVSCKKAPVAEALVKIEEPTAETLIVRSETTEAGEIGEPAVEPLIEALKDEDFNVRSEAAEALGNVGEPAIEPLIEALKDENFNLRMDTAEALGEIEEPAIEPLIEALKDENSGVRSEAAKALVNIGDERAVELLIEALKDEDLEVITGAYSFFIRRGEQGTEPVLIKVLNKYGTRSMAEDFLNCGNIQLEEAARKWAKENGYQITALPGETSLRWGSGQ